MSRGWTYISGDWNLVCDSCSKKIKASKSKHRWDGFIVCADCWEPRHSMDFIRARTDKITVPFVRPQPTDTFVDVGYTIYFEDGYILNGYIDDTVTSYVDANYGDDDYVYLN